MNVPHETLRDYPQPPQPDGAREITEARLMSVNLLLDGTLGCAFEIVAERPREQRPPVTPSAPQPKPGTPRHPRDDPRAQPPTKPRPGEQSRPVPNREVRPK